LTARKGAEVFASQRMQSFLQKISASSAALRLCGEKELARVCIALVSTTVPVYNGLAPQVLVPAWRCRFDGHPSE